MAKTLVTGGTGFIGSHVVRALARRGDELRLLVRSSARARQLEKHLGDIEFEPVTGNLRDRKALRRAMRDVDKVFHVAGITSMRPRDRKRVFQVNVEGTRNVMAEALGAGVERVVYTSSVAAIGPGKRGSTADETQTYTAGGLGIAYINSKHEAEVEVFQHAARGLPVVAVNPTFVLGPDDPTAGTSNALVRRFLLRQIPAYIEGALNIVDVRDVATGHLLADQKGRVGERYILGGRNFTLARLFSDLARVSGVAPPPIKLPAVIALAGVEAATRARIPIPTSVDEVRSGMQWWAYRSTKAQKELSFRARPHEETLEDTVSWLMERLGDRVGQRHPYDPALTVAGRAMRFGGKLLGR